MKMDAVKWHPGPFAASVTGFDENSDQHRRPFFYHHYHIIKRGFCQMPGEFPPKMLHGTAAALYFCHQLDKPGNRGTM
jgi:hypothetical protein